MITPAFGITATERVLPRLALDFTTASLDPRITFTRSGNTATVINSSGVITAVNADTPRFDYNPSTLVCQGLLIEEPRTNVLLNSLINGTNLATQSVTVTAAARTLSFYGTGQIALSGAHSATVTGTGAYPTRTTLTFTPSAGTLTLTVTGTVQFAQLELGSFATSFIPTTTTALTRNADQAVMTGTNFSSWYNATAGTVVVNATATGTAAYTFTMCGAGNSGNDALYNYVSTNYTTQSFTGGVLQANVNNGVVGGSAAKISVAYASNNFGTAANGGSTTTDASYTQATMDKMRIGASANNTITGIVYVRTLSYYPQRLTNAELQAFSK